MSMHKLCSGLVLCGSMLAFTGCLTAPFAPPMGAVTAVEAPLSIDHNRSAMASKKGESSAMCILGLVSVGDASTQAAAQEGGLKTVHFLDYKYFNVLGIYQKTTVMAYGE
ncbi:MAG TPA: TRL domain-containing protein [Kiritimatiellia bacterium]|nr:MAG: hypothetical protein BWX70_02512 [Verrucomicrobia bacterium ADurb.Bin070]HQQ92319.1 TRL domain-containing protein [Kiritimatiellia bacterium]